MTPAHSHQSALCSRRCRLAPHRSVACPNSVSRRAIRISSPSRKQGNNQHRFQVVAAATADGRRQQQRRPPAEAPPAPEGSRPRDTIGRGKPTVRWDHSQRSCTPERFSDQQSDDAHQGARSCRHALPHAAGRCNCIAMLKNSDVRPAQAEPGRTAVLGAGGGGAAAGARGACGCVRRPRYPAPMRGANLSTSHSHMHGKKYEAHVQLYA